MKSKLFLILIGSWLISSCSLFNQDDESSYVARVNSHYLTHEELSKHISKNLSEQDSTIEAKNYIRSWATDKLLLDRAKLNLPEEKQTRFKELSDKYEEQLFKKAYKDALIEKQLNTDIDSLEVVGYYQNHKSNFKLNEELIQFRYLQLDKKNKNLNNIKTEFKRFNDEDMLSLQDKSLEFKSLSLNDSVWVRVTDVLVEFEENKDIELQKNEILKAFQYFEIENETDVFLFYVGEVLKQNDEAPLSYVKPTIEQILLNKKKINISKIIEKEITKDATKNNEFEVY